MKNNKGFTLVELVVVIAIIGVLAAILVPSMLNYVKKSRLKAANTNAKTAYNAVSEFIIEQAAVKGMSQSDALAEYMAQPIDCTQVESGATDAREEVRSFLAQNGITAGKVWVDGVEINSNDSYYVQWTGDENPTADESIVGQYPDPVSWNTYKYDGCTWQTYIAPTES